MSEQRIIDFDTEIFHGMENIPQSPEGLNFDVKWGADFRLQDANGQEVRANRQVNEETGQVSYAYTMSSNSKHKIEFGGDWVTGTADAIGHAAVVSGVGMGVAGIATKVGVKVGTKAAVKALGKKSAGGVAARKLAVWAHKHPWAAKGLTALGFGGMLGGHGRLWRKETVTGIDLDDSSAYCKIVNEENGQQVEIREDPDNHAMNIATITDLNGNTTQIRIPNSKMGDAIPYLQNAVYNNTMEIKDGKLTFKAKEDIAKEKADQEYSALLNQRSADIAQLEAAANAPIPPLPKDMSDKEVARLLSESPVQGDTYLNIDEKGQYLPGSKSSPIATTGCTMKEDGRIVANSDRGGKIQVRGMGTYNIDQNGKITDKEGKEVKLETLKQGAQNYNAALDYTKKLNERDIAQKKLDLYNKAKDSGRPKDAIEILDASPEQLHTIAEKEKILEGVSPKQLLDQRVALVELYMASGLSLEQAEARFKREFGDLNDDKNHAGKRKLALTIPDVNDQINQAASNKSAEEKFSEGAEKGDFSGLFGDFGKMFEQILKLIQTFLGGGQEASHENAAAQAQQTSAPSVSTAAPAPGSEASGQIETGVNKPTLPDRQNPNPGAAPAQNQGPEK